MFAKVLVANRGEIACRIMRTLRALGIGSVAVYHHVDRASPHVRMADEAVWIDASVPSAAYLDPEQILAACKATGAEALHPGYGFLSENADFAQRVEDAGFVFVGPDPASMRLMGDKIRSRNFAAEHGIPIAPSALQEGNLESFVQAAGKVGFPLLIKASAGGGGKGMRIVREAAELDPAVRLASGEAERYFKDGRIYAERLVERPRHIEVQVLGDGKGKVVHLFERECSLQRRYQKIVEETPAPNLPSSLRDEICASAVRLASAARYRNAGTVEFILAPDGAYYFLEMNTRLQVEHPVTEEVTGLDLVEEQLRIAATGELSISQAAVSQSGHAIECRICAEDPAADFRPSTGRVGVLLEPAGARFDSGVAEGTEVTPAFDSMLAKLIVHGADRSEARVRMETALKELVVLGVRTNIDYLARLMAHRAFADGRTHTGFLGEHASDLAAPRPSHPERDAILAAGLLSQQGFRTVAVDTPEPYASIGAWRS